MITPMPMSIAFTLNLVENLATRKLLAGKMQASWLFSGMN
jgi:hypothetical protein